MAKDSLYQRAGRSVVWTLSSTVVNRSSQFVSNLVLAWLLSPDDFGLISLCYASASMVLMLRHSGIGSVLIQQKEKIDAMAGSAASSALAAGTVTAGLLVGLGVLMSWFYGLPELFGLLCVLALAMPLESLRVVPETRLRYAMKFHLVALLNSSQFLLIAICSITFAALGFGAYSFVLPQLVVLPLLLIALRFLAGPTWTSVPRWSYIRMLMGNGMMITTGLFAMQIINQGDYLLLGRHFPPEYVGVYFLAFSLSNQAIMSVVGNIVSVFQAYLANLKEEGGERRWAFRQTLRMVAFAAVPTCLAMSAFAQPAIDTLFDPRWYDAGVLMQVIAAGMSLRVLGFVVTPLMEAEKRWRAWTAMMWGTAAAYAGVLWYVTQHGRLATAWAVAALLSVSSVVHLTVALKRWPRDWGFYRDIFAVPFALSAIVFYGSAWAVSVMNWPGWLELAVGLLVSGLAYLAGSWWLNRPIVVEVYGRFVGVLRRNAGPHDPSSGQAGEAAVDPSPPIEEVPNPARRYP
ncbi:MAG: oligosaccharide flippase family protein [Planctomycetota bacterium]